jgi:hypothetical protein
MQPFFYLENLAIRKCPDIILTTEFPLERIPAFSDDEF